MTLPFVYSPGECYIMGANPVNDTHRKEKVMVLNDDCPEFLNCLDENSFSSAPQEKGLQAQESHPEREILLILAGESLFTLNGRNVPCTPGSAFFINSNLPHQLGYRGINSDIIHIWVHLHPKRFFAMLYQISARTPYRSCRSWEFSLPMLEFINSRWEQALKAPQSLRQEIYRSIARIIIEEIRLIPEHTGDPVAVERDIVGWMKKHISLNCGRNSSMEELEKLTGYNRFHLMRKFKSACGMTVGEYINTVRRAFVAGNAPRMSQKEMAARLGFSSAAAFWLWQSKDRQKNSSEQKK